MHILISPNAFKNSLDAPAAAAAIQEGLERSDLSCTTDVFPIADGGDGTGKLLLEKLTGKSIPVTVHDPFGREIISSFGLIDGGKTAVIELADASGLRRLQAGEYDPLHCTTFGTGELIKHALDKNVNRIIMGIGGSATIDAGAGILQALGIRFLGAAGQPLQDIPAGLIDLASIDGSALDKRIRDIELIVLCDVDNRLLGTDGAAAVFGPQKGASEEAIGKLERALSRLRDITFKMQGTDLASIKYGGAAGGTAAGLSAFIGARLVSGVEYFLDMTGFDEFLERADLIITGEGSIDLQTLQGKGPFGVARRAKKKNIPVIGLGGKIPLNGSTAWRPYFDVLLPINNEVSEIDKALQNTAANLTRTAKAIGDLFAISNHL